ncbi:MAG: glycosyl hydrolase, partial [Gemmatimonadota bacterium]
MNRTLRRRAVRAAPRLLLAVALTCGSGLPAAAQTVAYDTSYFAGLSFRNVGPVRGGRSTAVAGTTARPFEYYFGATGGGVWKTTDGGTTWSPVSDDYFTSSSVGAIGQCEANPDIVYVGMGEVQLRGNIMQGDGAYRSTDGGETWEHIGLRNTQAIGRLRVHPTNCEIVYAAVLGHPYGPNDERGVLRTRDGGATWEKVLYRNAETGAVDLVLDPADPDVLFATFWQVHRTPWSLESGGPGGGLFRSADGGSSWTELTKNPGLPSGIWGKSGVAVSGADSNRVWAIIEADSGGVFRSDDGGATWQLTNDDRSMRQRAFYYSRIYAHPTDRDQVFVLNVAFHASDDGGETFGRTIRVPHSDNHDLWIDPANPERWINANDGGANVSVNAGRTWTGQDYATAQLYHITVTNHDPYRVCGAQQDNSTACMPSRNVNVLPDHMAVGGGESGYIASDPTNPDIFYAGSYGGLLTRFDAATGESRRINIWPDNPMGHSAGEITERFQWTFPIMFSRAGPKRLYAGSQHLWVTTNEGMSWDRISPDLARADPSTLGASGGPITRDQTSVEYYGTIFTIAPSPHDGNTIWIGTDDGHVQLTRDHGSTWTNITPPDMPDYTRISLIEVSPHRPGSAYVAGKRYQLDDRNPYIWYTEDFGSTWRRIDSGIPADHYVHAVREDPVREGLLFAGTEHGLRVSFDNGASWSDFSRNLPDTQVPDLMLEGNDLVIATHGRSAWIMDDISRLRQLNADVVAAPVHLFDPVDPVRGDDNAVSLVYHLKDPARTVTLEFVDAGGHVIRSYTAEPRDEDED